MIGKGQLSTEILKTVFACVLSGVQIVMVVQGIPIVKLYVTYVTNIVRGLGFYFNTLLYAMIL